jgi:hypothetical protein
MGPIGKRDHCWCLLVLTTTGKSSQRYEPSFLPSECEWFLRYVFELAMPTLVETAIVERIKQKINTDGDRQIYNPLINCILDKNSS